MVELIEEEEEKNKKSKPTHMASARKNQEEQLRDDMATLFPAAREGGVGSVEDGVFLLGAQMEKEKGRKVSREEIAQEARKKAREVRLKNDIETLVPATREGGALSHKDGEFVYAAILGGDAGETGKVSRDDLADFVHGRAEEVRKPKASVAGIASAPMETAMKHVAETKLANVKIYDTPQEIHAQLSLPKVKPGPKLPDLS